uniref:PNPLA domain-containing protein n=1 Tax=Lotharella globosa TaxID=91324 RepID=A0A7S4DTE3_9EUKA|mmetsp:Transcript_33047/g.63832  ORF Transcript_33047/g.63832 Transcript_33047/m.63832 type:complete len:307 (+) Transcript_33047:3-923(+)
MRPPPTPRGLLHAARRLFRPVRTPRKRGLCGPSGAVEEKDRRRVEGGGGGARHKRLQRLALSGSGWLLPFHVGACHQLREMGYIDENTEYAGASGGSLVAAAICCGFSHEEIMAHVLDLACWYRNSPPSLGKLEAEMRGRFRDILPSDAPKRVEGRLHISVLPIRPTNRFTQKLHRDFETTEDLIEAVLTSSYIPFYLGPYPAKYYRDEWCIDGGIGNAVPPFPGSLSVCPLPGTGVAASRFHPARFIASDVDITPDLLDFGHVAAIPGYPLLLRHALSPARDEVLWRYYECGVESAKEWSTRCTT